MQVLKTILAVLLTATLPMVAQATEYRATVKLTTTITILPGREGVPVGVIRLVFPPVSTFGPCRSESADIYNTTANKHLILKAFLAEATGKMIEVTVDDGIARYDANVCHVMLLK